MFWLGLKVINSRLCYKWIKPRYKLCGINFENNIPLLQIVDRKNEDAHTLLTAMEVMARRNMIAKFSAEDMSRICYCLSQEYFVMDKQQLFAIQNECHIKSELVDMN